MTEAAKPMTSEKEGSWFRRVMRSAKANAKANPYLSVLFGFWAFGYTMMVPTLLGSHFMAYISEQLGGKAEMLFVAFAALMINVVLFAVIVPFVLWMLVCWALRNDK